MMANRLKIMCNIGGDDCVAAKDLCVSACHKDFLQSHFVGKWGLGLPEKPLYGTMVVRMSDLARSAEDLGPTYIDIGEDTNVEKKTVSTKCGKVSVSKRK